MTPSFGSVRLGEAAEGKRVRAVWQTLGVGYGVSQRRESDTRPVRGDNEETEARPQSHMKRIFGGSPSLESLHPASRFIPVSSSSL